MDFINKFFSKYPQDKIIKWFKKICLAEALSCMLLYGVAMIWIRYDENIYSIIFISVIGSLHGFFFTLYLLFCLPVRKIYAWDDEDFVFALLSAFFPFATVWVDKKLARFNRE